MALSLQSFQFVLTDFFHCQQMEAIFQLHLVSVQQSESPVAHIHSHIHTLDSLEDRSEVDSKLGDTYSTHVSTSIWGNLFSWAPRWLQQWHFTLAHTHTHLSVIGASLCDHADEGSRLRGCSLETSCALFCTSRWPSGPLTVHASVCVCRSICVRQFQI